MWDAFVWKSAAQVAHLKTFAFVRGLDYRGLEPQAELVVPNKTGPGYGYTGWAYCARTPDKALFLLYFEVGAPAEASLRGLDIFGRYRARFFDPRKGEWLPEGPTLTVPASSVLALPPRPDDRDWGMMLECI
jgi:hypothetical protein